jgi:hypothetical protein
VEGDKTTREKDGKYDSEFPAKPVSAHLRKILKSIHLVSVMAFYKSYHFDFEETITYDTLLDDKFHLDSREPVIFEQPATGTASLIYNDREKIAFLTCAHIINFPDTVVTPYSYKTASGQKVIKRFIKKARQTGNIINQPMAYNFDVLVMDEELDLALLGKKIEHGNLEFLISDPVDNSDEPIRVLTLPRGKANELDWGTFVYLIGFPRAKRMVSSALVSSPNYDLEHSFLLDGALQKGISGGIVLAIRDDVPNFELVGMAKGISGKMQYILTPEKKLHINDWEIHEPYDAEIYIEKQEIIEPGMIFVTSIETILSFLDQNREILLQKGYQPDLFFR